MDLGHLGLTEVRGLANRSEGLGRLASPTDVRGWGAGLAWAPSIKMRGWDRAGLGPVDKSEGLGAKALSIKVKGYVGWAC